MSGLELGGLRGRQLVEKVDRSVVKFGQAARNEALCRAITMRLNRDLYDYEDQLAHSLTTGFMDRGADEIREGVRRIARTQAVETVVHEYLAISHSARKRRLMEALS